MALFNLLMCSSESCIQFLYACNISRISFSWQKHEAIFPECCVEECEEPGLQPLPSSLAILKWKWALSHNWTSQMLKTMDDCDGSGYFK